VEIVGTDPRAVQNGLSVNPVTIIILVLS
jgi:hypothetical protein